MKVKSKVTKDGALNMIKMLRNSSLRAKISPDGQLIRTTNLPKYAKYFPYILSSYPNSYYDWQFKYEISTKYGMREDGTHGSIPYIKGEDYFSPADLAKKPTHFDKDVTDECLDMWTEKAKKYVELTFNVDYRTIGEKWVQEMFDVSFKKGDIPQNEETQKSLFRDYIPIMKKNKTIVESSMVAADRSSIYRFGHSYVVRVYVKYRILSSNVKYEDAINEKGKFYIDDHKIFNRILYSRWFTSISKFKIGQWKTGYFDILIDANQMRKSSMDLGVSDDSLSELFMKPE